MQNYFRQLEAEQRVGAQGYEKRKGGGKKIIKKSPRLNNAKGKPRFHQVENAAFFPGKNLCVYLFAAPWNKELLKQSSSSRGIPQIRG